MTANKSTIERYMDGFRNGDHGLILSCLTEDVRWEIPGMLDLSGMEAFDEEIENDQFIGRPHITVTRMTEENDVVVAEGTVKAQKKDGEHILLAFCDVFEMRAGRIRRLVSYLVPLPLAATSR